MDDKLQPFDELVDDATVPAAKIAEMADVTEAEVVARRAQRRVEPAATEPEKPRRGGRPPKVEVVAPEPVPDTPDTVRVVRKGVVSGPDRRTWLLKRFDVVRGERARWLWANHREMVEIVR